MAGDALPTKLTPAEEWRRGWTIVLGAAAGGATGSALFFYVSSFFVTPLVLEFGWTRGQIASAIALTGLGGFAAPLIGYLIDRFGVRLVTATCTSVIASCYVGLALMPKSYALFVFYFLIIGVAGIGTIGFAYSRPIATWFTTHRGFALGVASSGVAISAAFAPPLLQWIIGDFGWRWGYGFLAMAAVGIGLPLSLLLLRDSPPEDETNCEPSKRVILSRSEKWLAVRAISRVRSFWLLAIAIFSINVAGSGALSQLVPLLTDRGLSAALASFGVSAYASGLMIGRVCCGWLLDQGRPWLVAFAFTAIPAFGIAIMLFPVLSFSVAIFACFLIGLQQGSEFDVMAYLVAQIFGITSFATIYGAIYVSGLLGVTAGMTMFGVLYDLNGNYDIALTVACGCFLIGATSFLMTADDVRKSRLTS
jgi:MFS family permease